MSESPDLSLKGVERRSLAEFTEQAYLNYSMYVIVNRTLPHIGGDLKLVRRRITYAMSELGLDANSRHKESTRTVGDAFDKLYPHGDSTCCEAVALMAQPLSYRHPLVDGQGSWGAPNDPKSLAAMCYTEVHLSRYFEVLLSELDQGTVDQVSSFDGTLDEPVVLPICLPSLLLNGTTDIAIGMTADVSPHNLREVTSAYVRLFDQPGAATAESYERVPGPNFPAEAEIIAPRADLREIYETDRSLARMHVAYHVKDGDIIIRALPHQVSDSRMLEQIAGQMQAKKLSMVTNLRDESDHKNPTRIIIISRLNRVDVEGLMTHLFTTTDLEISYRVNPSIIGLDGKSQVKGLRQLLSEWLQFRVGTTCRHLQLRLDKVKCRLRLLDGLLVAFLSLDGVIYIVRTEDQPKAVLTERLELSEVQAGYILDIRLRQLARLEETKIRGKQEELLKEQKRLQILLSSETKLKKLMCEELIKGTKICSGGRRPPIVTRAEVRALSETELMPIEPAVVALSGKGWVHCAKGHDIDTAGLSHKAGDGSKTAAPGCSNQYAVFTDSTGRSYPLPVHSLPSARGQDEPPSNRLAPPSGASLGCVLLLDDDTPLVVAFDADYGSVVKGEGLQIGGKVGRALFGLPNGSAVVAPRPVRDVEQDWLAAMTIEGRLLLFEVSGLSQSGKGKDNKIIGIPGERMVSREGCLTDLAVLPVGTTLVLQAGEYIPSLKGDDLEHYKKEQDR